MQCWLVLFINVFTTNAMLNSKYPSTPNTRNWGTTEVKISWLLLNAHFINQK